MANSSQETRLYLLSPAFACHVQHAQAAIVRSIRYASLVRGDVRLSVRPLSQLAAYLLWKVAGTCSPHNGTQSPLPNDLSTEWHSESSQPFLEQLGGYGQALRGARTVQR